MDEGPVNLQTIERNEAEQQNPYDLKYDRFNTRDQTFTKEKLSVFMNYWIADLLIDCFYSEKVFVDDNIRKGKIKYHVLHLLNPHFFERLKNKEVDNDELITAFNHVFFEKIHKNLHFSRGEITSKIDVFLKEREEGQEGEVVKEQIIRYVIQNILKSDLIRDFVLDSIQNIGGRFSQAFFKRNEKKTSLTSVIETDTIIIPFKLITILKFNHFPYLEQIYDYPKDGKSEIKEKIEVNEKELRELETMFIFNDITKKCKNFAEFVTAKAKSERPPSTLTEYDTRRLSSSQQPLRTSSE